jgi:glycine betaine/proline transport system substrate-binding protein
MLSKKLLAISCATAISGYGSVAQAADVVIGVPNWPSVLVTAHVLKVAMENNLGLEVELQSATNPVVFEAMDSGSMHVHPEVWMPNQVNLNNKFVVEKKTVRQNPNGVAGDQAMCVTKGTAERTGIVNLSDLTDPEMAKNFDTDGDGMGEIWIGAAGWASTVIEKIRAKSYGYDATMTLKEIDETLALAEVDSAVAKGENITFFCYTPHHMFALHDLVILKEPAHDPAQWNVIQPTDDPEWLSKSTAGVAWSSAYLHIHYAASLETDQPEAAAMLAKVALDTATVSAMTYALVVEKQDPATFAAKWVEDNAEVVDSWLQ